MNKTQQALKSKPLNTDAKMHSETAIRRQQIVTESYVGVPSPVSTVEPRIASSVRAMWNHLDTESSLVSTIEYLTSKLGTMYGSGSQNTDNAEPDENTLASTLERQCRKQSDINDRLAFIAEHLQSLIGAE